MSVEWNDQSSHRRGDAFVCGWLWDGVVKAREVSNRRSKFGDTTFISGPPDDCVEGTVCCRGELEAVTFSSMIIGCVVDSKMDASLWFDDIIATDYGGQWWRCRTRC